MQNLKMFLEYRTVNEVVIKCSETGKEINPEYTIDDEESLNDLINRYKQNKQQFENASIFFCYLKGNTWIAKTKINYSLDLGRISDKFLSSGKVNYSLDDVKSLVESGDTMIIFVNKIQ